MQRAGNREAIAEIVDKIDRDIRKIHVEADEVDQHNDEYPEQFAVLRDRAPVEHLRQLPPIGLFLAAGLEIGRIL